MSIYAVGDIQGCYDELHALLELVEFDLEKDILWFAGDLVCRGPKSLETLRFVRNLQLQGKAITVLGNHELHLLALHYLPELTRESSRRSGFHDILTAPDCHELCEWLRQQPFLYESEKADYLISHAGIYPFWSLSEASLYASELEHALQKGSAPEFFKEIHGDSPQQWSQSLTGWDRLRFICHAFTRMRFCSQSGCLDFEFKGEVGSQAEGLLPWFALSSGFKLERKVLFGHWAALKGETGRSDILALDGGCVWGGELIALRLEDQRLFKITCKACNGE